MAICQSPFCRSDCVSCSATATEPLPATRLGLLHMLRTIDHSNEMHALLHPRLLDDLSEGHPPRRVNSEHTGEHG